MTEWQENAWANVETPAGPLRVVVHGPISEYSDRHTRSAVAMTDGAHYDRPATHATINGVAYSLTVTLEQGEDGSWSLQRDEYGRDYGAITGMRSAWSNYNEAHLTDAATRFVREKVAPVLIAFLGDHPELIRQGDKATAAQTAHSLERTLAAKRAELAKLEDKLADALLILSA